MTRQVVAEVLRASARERALARLAAALLAGAVFAAAIALAVIALGGGRWIDLPRAVPALASAAAVAAAAAAAFFGVRRARIAGDARAVARAAESEKSLRRGSLAALVELGAVPLAARDAARLGAELDPAPLAAARMRAWRMRAAACAAALVVAVSGFTWSAVRAPDGVRVLVHPVRAARGDLVPPLRFASAPVRVARGRRVVVDVRAPGRRWVEVHTRAAGESWRVRRLAVVNGQARADLGAIAALTRVVARDHRRSTDTLVITPVDRPFIVDVRLFATYPAYLSRAPEALPADAPIVVPAGTTLHATARASVPLRTVAPDHGTARLERGASVFSAIIRPVRSAAIAFNAVAVSGERVEALPLHVTVVPDDAPEIEILAPSADTTVEGDARVPVTIRARDDHTIASAGLTIRAPSGERRVALPLAGSGGTATTMLDVAALPAGTRVTVQAVAADASPWRNTAASVSRTITVASLGARRELARMAADSVARAATAVTTAQRSAERGTADLARARSGADPATARAAAENQRALTARTDSLARATRALESRLARAGALDEALAARLAEVRALLQRALTPELAARLRDVENAARRNDDDAVRAALSDVAEQQRRAREQLERVVRMLRRAAIEGSLETLRADAEELAARGAPARAGERVTAGIDDVLRQLREEQARAGVSPTERAGAAARAGSFESAASDLRAARDAQVAEWRRELTADLDAAVHDLLRLSAEQGALAGRVDPRGEWRDAQGAVAEGAAAVAERVTRASRVSALVSPRSEALARAARAQAARVGGPAVPQRDAGQVAAAMRESATAMARAAASLVRDRDRTNSARSASGFAELLAELQQLAAQQRSLNASSSALAQLLGGGGGEARERARALARQQRQVAAALEEIGDAPGGARAEPLAAEAHRLADALETAAVDASVLQRQERLYHRLLEGGRLLTGSDDDREGERRATAAGDAPVGVAPSANATTDRVHLPPGWLELRGLTPAERQLIIDYFERLNARR